MPGGPAPDAPVGDQLVGDYEATLFSGAAYNYLRTLVHSPRGEGRSSGVRGRGTRCTLRLFTSLHSSTLLPDRFSFAREYVRTVPRLSALLGDLPCLVECRWRLLFSIPKPLCSTPLGIQQARAAEMQAIRRTVLKVGFVLHLCRVDHLITANAGMARSVTRVHLGWRVEA